MSIIERAIDKVDGIETLPDTDRKGSGETAEKTDNVIEASQNPSNRENLQVVEESGSEKQKLPTDGLEKEKTRPETDGASPNPGWGASEAQTQKDGDNYIQIDLERLSAAGFLTPDTVANGISEEYQQIKRKLLDNTIPGKAPNQNNPNLIMVTSSVPSEGKTFTSVNLAMSLAAEIDHTVLAIDTDIAKRDLTRAFNATGRPGIFDVLVDPELSLADVMLRTNIPNFVVIPAGLTTDSSTELLASTRMREICQEIAVRYNDRIVIFDTPPVLATSAALALGPQMGQVALVVEAGKTKQETLSEALGLLERVQITGLVLNKSKHQRRSAYDYYGYYYQAGN